MDDVDVTMGGTHEDIKAYLTPNPSPNREGREFSFFDTEKYGTMTIIPKEYNEYSELSEEPEKNNLNISENSKFLKVQYEITPFRTETTYSDGRHPDEVVRSDSLLEDSQRRDFTINCLYYQRVQI
jgi:tRNA nucleotidyltransferase/poly(A) polymerase